ncbi:EF-hand domain-containing protein [Sphingomonas sp. FW199]|uniref:EF-hand domain-containing protein n=1 Tax=Sphingomonas sp. FW199 TaxID=3400217 RepID=UPI003CFB4F81
MSAIALAALLALSGQQAAPPAPPPVVPTMPRALIMAEPLALFFAGCDGDGDAVLARAELVACVDRTFRPMLDKGGVAAGYIAWSDWAERYLGDRNALPSPFAVDGDRDDRITPDECLAAMNQGFDRMDRDKDGRLTRAEMLTIAGARSMDGDMRRDRPPQRRR